MEICAMSLDIQPNIVIRDITGDDIELVHKFIVNTQGPAENECDERYIKALMKKGLLRIEGQIRFPEKEATAPSKTDYLHWIVDNEGLHFGKIAILDGTIVGVLLCYTQPKNHKAFLSNIAVAHQHRRKGIGSILMDELISFYKQKSGIEAIEVGVALTNSIAVKFYLEHYFKIIKLKDTGYTMQYALKNGKI